MRVGLPRRAAGALLHSLPSHWKAEAGVVSSSLSRMFSGATHDAMPGSTKSLFTQEASQRRLQSQYSWLEPRALQDRHEGFIYDHSK